jgi:type I restriction enzyme M protein
VAELAENDFNLNIRRYVDNTPPPEPQDVRARLYGGVPEAETRAHAGSFAAYGIEVDSLFSAAERTRGYRDFPPDGWQGVVDEIPGLTADKRKQYPTRWTTDGTVTSSTSWSFRLRARAG